MLEPYQPKFQQAHRPSCPLAPLSPPGITSQVSTLPRTTTTTTSTIQKQNSVWGCFSIIIITYTLIVDYYYYNYCKFSTLANLDLVINISITNYAKAITSKHIP